MHKRIKSPLPCSSVIFTVVHGACTVHTPHMGRLAELWKGRSPDAVATALHRRWPAAAGDRPKNPRTIGNRLRELDQGKELTYWRKRPALVHALARELKVDDAELAPLLGDSAGAQVAAGLKFTAIGELRSLALDRENLFPGLPEEVLSPERWTRHWWRVPDRLTRDLVARWHELHQRAAVLRKPTWEDALPVLPRSGRVLLVLDAQTEPTRDELRSAGMPRMVLAKRAEPSLDSLHGLHGLFLCVLAPSAAYADAQAAFGTDVWNVVDDRAPDEWLAHLAAWARDRARPGGGLRKKSAQELLSTRLSEYAGWFAGPREALELCALLDEIGCGPHDERTLARRYLESLWREHDETLGPRRAWLRAHGFSTLLALVCEAIFREGDAWLAGLPYSSWEALVPGNALASDVEEARALLRLGPLTENLRAQVLARLEPGPRQFIDDLAAVGMLDRRVNGPLQVVPHWQAMCVRKAALEDMLSGPWDLWAARLAQPVFAAAAVSTLARALAAGDFARLDEVLTRATDREYAHLLALDTCVRAAGLARLRGAELPRERVAALWRAIGPILQPALDGELPQPLFFGADQQRLLGHDVFVVACLSLTEVLTNEEAGAFAALWQPGLGSQSTRALQAPTDELFGRLLKRPSRDLDGMLRLGARWLERCEPFGAPDDVPEFILPAWIVRELIRDTPAPEIWKCLQGHPIALELPALMHRYCELAGLPFQEVIERAWRAWDWAASDGDPPRWFWWVRDAPRQAARVWKHLPADVMRGPLRSRLTERHSRIYPNAWRVLDAAQWTTWMEIVRGIDRLRTRHDLVAALQHLPESLLHSALSSGILEEFPGTAFEIVWARLGDTLPDRLPELRRQRTRTAWSLLRCAPEPWRPACLDLLLEWLDALDASETLDAEAFLRSCIATRGPLAPRAWDGLRLLATRT